MENNWHEFTWGIKMIIKENRWKKTRTNHIKPRLLDKRWRKADKETWTQ